MKQPEAYKNVGAHFTCARPGGGKPRPYGVLSRQKSSDLYEYEMSTENKAFTLSPFMSEWLAGGQPSNQLPISAVCNSHCLFCSNHLNPFPVAGGFFRDIEDIKLQLCAMSANDDPIRMSDSLPGRISEGEALLHPQLFEILELVRRKFFYNTLCFTTNASMLDSVFLKKLSAFKPIEINVSLHSLEPALWARIFGQDTKRAEIAISSLPLIRAHRMDLIGTIVPLPKICGWDDIERTYSHFVSQGASSMILYWPGYTKRTRPEVAADLECSLAEFTDFAERMKTAYRVPLIPHPDMVSPLPIPVETIVAKTLKGNPKNNGAAYRKVVWLSSAAAYDRLQSLVKDKTASASNIHQVEAVENETYGGNIMAAGLLMVEDFIRAGKKALERWPDAELFLAPREPFDSLLRDLQGTPAYTIAERSWQTCVGGGSSRRDRSSCEPASCDATEYFHDASSGSHGAFQPGTIRGGRDRSRP